MINKRTESISLILPIYNEAPVIKSVVTKCHRILSESFNDFEMILVNDGSKDGSDVILEELSRKNSKIRYVDNYINLNQGLSIQRGMAVAAKDFVLHNAVDLALAVEDIAPLMEKATQCDLLVVERLSSPGYTFWRRTTSFVNQVIRRILFPTINNGIRDMNFVQFYRRSILMNIMPLATSPAFTTPEMIYRAQLKGYHVMACKAKYRRRSTGKGALGKPHDILWSLYDMLRFRFYLWTLKNDPEEYYRVKG
ncbi:glycosyltransferase family 2 protein [bacterium]|nr:glycosyltransferase family 2 protein [bacterium]